MVEMYFKLKVERGMRTGGDIQYTLLPFLPLSLFFEGQRKGERFKTIP